MQPQGLVSSPALVALSCPWEGRGLCSSWGHVGDRQGHPGLCTTCWGSSLALPSLSPKSHIPKSHKKGDTAVGTVATSTGGGPGAAVSLAKVTVFPQPLPRGTGPWFRVSLLSCVPSPIPGWRQQHRGPWGSISPPTPPWGLPGAPPSGAAPSLSSCSSAPPQRKEPDPQQDTELLTSLFQSATAALQHPPHCPHAPRDRRELGTLQWQQSLFKA